ncbi:MAG TPA: 4a-hydroxytetrahydrobiopterin dehydratase [Polyangiaceae bacterium]|nr:4a-hydroxytetrahydrobiopterin dehydratase [Polyangiaceae bacterium]
MGSSKLCTLHCRANAPLLTPGELSLMHSEVGSWQVDERGRLAKAFPLPNFADALALANRIGVVAEAEDHHPELTVAWGSLRVVTWTHSAGGLSANDFILAARIDEL